MRPRARPPAGHPPTRATRCREAARSPAGRGLYAPERTVRKMAAAAVLAVLLLPAAAAAQEPELPLSAPVAKHRVMRAELDQAPNPELERDLESWTEICDRDDLTGEIARCYLQSPMYSEASSSAPGFFTALLHAECDGEVWISTSRGKTNPNGVPIVGSAEDMRPTRAVVEGVVQDAADPARNILFVRDSASWAGTTLAFEARHPDNSTAVWRLPFGEMERQIVETFLNGPACPRAAPEVVSLPPETPKPVAPAQRRQVGLSPPPDGDFRSPSCTFRPKAQYTKMARRARLQGVVILRLTISETGQVMDVTALKEMAMGLTENAIAAAEQWKCRPATLDGDSVAAYLDATVNFQLH